MLEIQGMSSIGKVENSQNYTSDGGNEGANFSLIPVCTKELYRLNTIDRVTHYLLLSSLILYMYTCDIYITGGIMLWTLGVHN